jgi:hypothetical protein
MGVLRTTAAAEFEEAAAGLVRAGCMTSAACAAVASVLTRAVPADRFSDGASAAARAAERSSAAVPRALAGLGAAAVRRTTGAPLRPGAAPALAAGEGVVFPLPAEFPGGASGLGACSRRCSCELVIGPAATTSSIRRTGMAVETRPPAMEPGERGWLSVGTCRAARASPRGGSVILLSGNRATCSAVGRPVGATVRAIGPEATAPGGAATDDAEAAAADDAEGAEAADDAEAVDEPDAADEAEPAEEVEPAEDAGATEDAGTNAGLGPSVSDELGSHQRGGRTSAPPVDRTGARTPAASARRIATGRPVAAANRCEDSATRPRWLARASRAGRPGRRSRSAAARPTRFGSSRPESGAGSSRPESGAGSRPGSPVIGSSTGSRDARPPAAPAAVRCWWR